MIMKLFLDIIAFILIISLFGTTASSQETTIVSLKVGECSLTVESHDTWHTLKLRAYHPKYRYCHIDKDSMLSALSIAFLNTELPKFEGNYSSLFIGRLIDYPWLSQYLAVAAYRDDRWDSRRGKPTANNINKYVSKVLSKKDLLSQIEEIFAKSGYRIIGVSAEKVLVGGFREVPLYQGDMAPGLVPYDALVWFRLERNGLHEK
jgi:hypothetical protein